MYRRQRIVWWFLGLMATLFVAGSWSSTYYVDWLWFQNLGYADVFWRSLLSKWGVGVLTGLLFGGVIFVNLWLAAGEGVYLPPNVIPFPYYRWLRPKGVLLLALVVAAFLGSLGGIALSRDWLAFLLFANRSSFGVADPVFQKDASFFIFSLPLWNLSQQLLGAALVLSLLLVGALYFFTGKVSISERWVNVHPRARSHLFALLGLFFFVKALGYWLSMYSLVYSPRGVAFGASYADIFVQLPGLRVMTFLALTVGVLALMNVRWRNYRLLIGGVGILLAASLLLGNVLPFLVQEFVVKPNEIAKETPYIKKNIAYTRQAYGLDRIREQEFAAKDDLTSRDLASQRGTTENIRLWDWRVLQSSYQQLQGIRPYYVFQDIDVDRYQIGGRYRQVVLSGREIDYAALPAKSWLNQHLKYTHGYGVVVTPASEVTREGLPPLWVKDIPPTRASELGEALKVDRPEIYFGEKSNIYSIVNTQEQEFNYPQGDQNQYTTYKGKDGVPIGSMVQRLAFALHTGDYNVLFSRAVGAESRVLIYRNIAQRVEKIAPFLLYDRDPYLVVDQGRLVWMWDAYTITGAYPYSEPTGMAVRGGNISFNYIRNAVKVVIDAYDGSVRFFAADPQDPLLKSYARVFPGLFRPLAEMPAGLRSHLRYPEDLFRVQVEKYAKYHMQDPVVFYNKEDLWARPLELTGNERGEMAPYFVNMQLPGEKEPEFLLMTPYTPNKKQNMIAWLAARSDGERYGELVVYKFPKQKLIYGPEQVESLITQNDVIAEKITLWSQQGSEVHRGNLLVIPVQDSLLYIEPLYLQSSATKLPELRRVVAVYRNQVVMAETLERALAAIFGAVPADGARDAAPRGTEPGTAVTPPGDRRAAGPSGETIGSLAQEADRLFREAQNALRAGDFAGYGERTQRLGQVLRQLQEQSSRP